VKKKVNESTDELFANQQRLIESQRKVIDNLRESLTISDLLIDALKDRINRLEKEEEVKIK
jgi:RecA/RadA recombinase